MAIPNKPAGPYTLDSTNALTTGATVYMMDTADSGNATAPTALGMTREQGFYRTNGAVTVKTDDPHGVGLYRPGGTPDNYIVISDPNAGMTDTDAYNVPFTKLFVFRPDTANATLFHSAARDNGDFNYATGAQLVRLNNGEVQFLKSMEANLGGSTGEAIVGGELICAALSYDGTTLRVVVDGVDHGEFNAPASGWNIGKVALGQGAKDDSQDGMTFFMVAHWNDAKSATALQSLTANPYQLIGVADAGTPPPADTTKPTLLSHTTNTAGTQLTIQMSEDISQSAFIESMAVFSGGHAPIAGNTFTGDTWTITIDPPLAPGESVSFDFVAPNPTSGFGLYDLAGNTADSFSIPVLTNNATAPVDGKPTLPGYILMVLGDQTWADFKTETELATWVNGTDCRNLAQPVMIWNYLDRQLNFTGMQIGPLGSDDNKFITFSPAPGRAYWELEPDNADGSWGTLGDVIVTTNTTSWLVGMVFEGFKVHIPSTATGEPWRLRRNGWDQPGNKIGMKYCKFWNESTLQTYASNEYGAYAVMENCIFLETNAGKTTNTGNSGGYHVGNTYHSANASNPTAALENPDQVHGCVFYNYGATPYTGTGSGRSSNYSNLATTSAGCTHVSQTMFESGVRPAAGTAIIGGGGSRLVSINDANGNNRGLNPDAGAIQRTPAIPLAKGTLTKYEVDGSSLLVALTTENTVDSASISISPADSTSGAVSMGPFAMTLGAGTAAYDIDDIVPGNYLCTILLTNAGGSNPVSGTSAFSIVGVGGGTVDPGTSEPATAITLLGAVNTATAGTATAPMRVGLNGTHTGVVTVGLTDNAGGIFSPATPQIVNGDSMAFTYTAASAGTKTIVFTNDAGLVNPASLQVEVAAAQLPAPLVSIGTAVQSIMMGSRATLSGALDYKGDAAGTIELFFDPVPSGTPVKFTGAISVNGSTWTAQWPNLSVSEFRLRVKVTANGQTVEASTAILRIVGLSGIVNVPVA